MAKSSKKPQGPRATATTMRLHADIVEALDQHAKHHGLRSRTQMVEQILVKHMTEHPVKGQKLDLQSLL